MEFPASVDGVAAFIYGSTLLLIFPFTRFETFAFNPATAGQKCLIPLCGEGKGGDSLNSEGEAKYEGGAYSDWLCEYVLRSMISSLFLRIPISCARRVFFSVRDDTNVEKCRSNTTRKKIASKNSKEGG